MRISDWSSDGALPIDTILIQLHHLRINCCRETALTPVQLDNAGNVSPYLGPRKNLTRRQLDFRLNFFVLQPLVALQHNAVDDGIFLYLNREIALVITNLDIGNQFGCEQILQCQIKAFAIIRTRSEEQKSELQSLMRITYAV